MDMLKWTLQSSSSIKGQTVIFILALEEASLHRCFYKMVFSKYVVK